MDIVGIPTGINLTVSVIVFEPYYKKDDYPHVSVSPGTTIPLTITIE
jgi:hypothetical protein